MEYYCCTTINKNNGLLVNFICRYRPNLFIYCVCVVMQQEVSRNVSISSYNLWYLNFI